MEEKKYAPDTTHGYQNQTFEEHYARAFVAERYDEHEHPVGEENETRDSERKPNPMEFEAMLEWVRKPENHTYVTTGCAVLAAVITAIYTLFAILQWCAMRDSNQINRDSLQSVQRAFVNFKDISFSLVTIDGEKFWDFSATCENGGNTPAVGVTGHSDADSLLNPPTEEQFKGRLPNANRTSIGPKGIQSLSNIRKPYTFIYQPTDRVKVPHVVINGPAPYFWGWIIYRDIIPDTKLHLTEWCTAISQVQISPNGSNLKFGSCETHNCTDQYCSDYDEMISFSGLK